MMLSKVHKKRVNGNGFDAPNSCGFERSGHDLSKFELPEEAQFIQWKVTKKETPESIRMNDTCLLITDFVDDLSGRQDLNNSHYVQLLWW